MDNCGFIGIHWALGTTVLIGLAAAEFSGAKTLLAVPIAAVSITLSALCNNHEEIVKYRKRKLGDLVDFLCLWFEVLSYLASAATCARIASVTVDYMSYGKLREWIFGLQTDTTEEPWPDIFGVSVIVVITFLFMLGLEKSSALSLLLISSIMCGFVFLVIVGGTNTNIQYKKWSRDFKIHSWDSILTTAAVCSYGFVNDFSFVKKFKLLTVISITAITIIFYISTGLIFTLMSHYRELAGTAIPLIRVFEVRDIGWARPFMAVFTISIVSLALTEIIPALYTLFLKLASKEWQIFVYSLQYRSSLTGAPILAIFSSGSLTAILAFACPLSYLIRILSFSFLLKCAFKTSSDLYNCYKPIFFTSDDSECNGDVQYSKLINQRANKPKTRHQSKSKIRTFLSEAMTSKAANQYKKQCEKENGEDKECLLMDSYSNSRIDDGNDEIVSSASEDSDSLTCNDSDENSSSTDIDAVVQEYIDTVQVATVDDFDNTKYPTKRTTRLVTIIIASTFIGAICIAMSIHFKKFQLIWPCLFVFLVTNCVMLRTPQNNSEQIKNEILSPSLNTMFALTSISLNVILASTLVIDVWPGVLFWLLSGLLLFWRCDCCTCDGLIANAHYKEMHYLPAVENLLHQYNDKTVDTILITR